MGKKKILSLGGIPGSGKTETIKGLIHMLSDYQHLSTGKIAREIAAGYGFSAENFNLFPAYARENNIPYDSLIDEKLKQAGQQSNLLIDCRLGYYFIKDSFKVLLKIDIKKAAKRIYDDASRPDSQKYRPEITLEEVEKELIEREKSDSEKYYELYGTDYSDESHYDLVIDTGKPENGIPFVINKIVNAYNAWLKEPIAIPA